MYNPKHRADSREKGHHSREVRTLQQEGKGGWKCIAKCKQW